VGDDREQLFARSRRVLGFREKPRIFQRERGAVREHFEILSVGAWPAQAS